MAFMTALSEPPESDAARAALGRLTFHEPREIWAHEEREFTPWLRENADVLAEALGIDLELTASEHPVGDFSLDLVGRDLSNDAVLIVENQLGGTDHDHLGKLLTYTAGTGAQTIVWVATVFREEHRQALDWLNENTSEDVRFFAIAIQVVRIGNSDPAPLLKLVAQPNDWQKQVRAATRPARLEGKGALYVEFWGKYLEAVRLKHPEWTRAGQPGPWNWISMPSGISGTYIAASFAWGHRLRHEIYLDAGTAEQTSDLYSVFLSQRDVMEQAYGKELEFEELPGKRASRIAEYAEGDVAETERHEEFVEWFIDAGEKLRLALSQLNV
jgi:hypothetical protein